MAVVSRSEEGIVHDIHTSLVLSPLCAQRTVYDCSHTTFLFGTLRLLPKVKVTGRFNLLKPSFHPTTHSASHKAY